MDIFLIFTSEGLNNPPEPCGELFWASKSRPPYTAIIKLEEPKRFLMNSDCICLKEKKIV